MQTSTLLSPDTNRGDAAAATRERERERESVVKSSTKKQVVAGVGVGVGVGEDWESGRPHEISFPVLVGCYRTIDDVL